MSAQAHREQFVEPAIKIISKVGLDRTSTLIAQVADTPHAMFHYAFCGRNELQTEVVAAVTRQIDNHPRRGGQAAARSPS